MMSSKLLYNFKLGSTQSLESFNSISEPSDYVPQDAVAQALFYGLLFAGYRVEDAILATLRTTAARSVTDRDLG